MKKFAVNLVSLLAFLLMILAGSLIITLLVPIPAASFVLGMPLGMAAAYIAQFVVYRKLYDIYLDPFKHYRGRA